MKIRIKLNKYEYICEERKMLGECIGLMFSKKKNLMFRYDNERLLSYHMLFVFFPIWCVYLDKYFFVTKIDKLKPFTSISYGKAKYVLELYEEPDFDVGDYIKYLYKFIKRND